jgi:hypothetical protein
MRETKTVYVAYSNTDLTEGRGRDYPIAVCEMKITAERLARKRYVQGSNGPVRSMQLVKIDGKWYAPGEAVNVIPPTKDDIAEQKRIDERNAILAKAKEAGLTDDEINLLRST